jgi:LysM repeat protein
MRSRKRRAHLAVASRLPEGSMKQNERLLVYAVTGFLALILVVAVLFSREPGKEAHGATTKQFDELLQDGTQPADKKDKAAADTNRTGVPAPGDVSPQQPLAAAPKTMLAPDLVAQQLGPSRRDRTVRFVRVRPNDSLESIVRRWCGARDPWLAETKSLNEDLVTLRAGAEIAVPWVDDDVLLAALDAQKPRTLLANDADAGPGASPSGSTSGPVGDGTPAPSPALSFAVPGGTTPGNAAGSGTVGTGGSSVTSAVLPAAAGGTTYVVKKGDALWSIAARTYGKKNADRMIGEIKAANPGLGDGVREGQKIVLPKVSGTGA